MTTHNHLTTLASRIGLAIVLGLFSMAPAMAGKIYDNWDFRGEYKFAIFEAAWVTESGFIGNIDYCTAVGTVVADGAGSMEFIGTTRCNLEGRSPPKIEDISGFMGYDVQPNGEVLFYDEPYPDPSLSDPSMHGVLVDHGATILIDGTVGSEDLIYQHGSVAKQWGDKGVTNW